jgi:leucyl-tRNA synthetase
MASYQFLKIEKKWQQYWEEKEVYKAEDHSPKPKYYVLDMFPYPSGAGLHVGHPLGYIASDVMARYKKLQGFNVLHPMGFDSFGLPAEQYAIQTGQHPAITTEANIKRYKEQLRNIGFAYDWKREVRTSDPAYYKWTQWIFIQLFNSWYNLRSHKAEPIESLVAHLEQYGTENLQAHSEEGSPALSAAEWKVLDEAKREEVLQKYRLAYLEYMTVNWCPALGTVLANDEVKDGLSERGGHPVERKEMLQWAMRISAYSERLLQGLESLEWSEAMKEMQRNWIGKSMGAELRFQVEDKDLAIEVFTTRIDTIYGVTFLAIAPESDMVAALTTPAQAQAVADYVQWAKNRSERERMSEVKSVSGVFSGTYAINPFNGEKVAIWIADYVLAGYGTGAVMGVPSSDERDFRFAKHFQLPIVCVIEGSEQLEDPTTLKYGKMIQSGFLNGLDTEAAIEKAIQFVEEKGLGKRKINYRMRDAIFARQRYWGEPIPIFYENGLPKALRLEELPLELPQIDKYLPTESGAPPLGRAQNWHNKDGHPLELNTMPGWAGSSWYFLRYTDPHNADSFADKALTDYWGQVDLYIGGTEHAVGHLLYSRFWTKFLYDRGYISFEEPFRKLINQGMIQGRSNFVYRIKNSNQFVSLNLKDQYETTALHVDVNIVENDVLDLEAFKAWRPEFADAEFILEEGKYICGAEVEKMSKRWHNVVNPDDVVARYGADTLRLYEMFLGPLEQFKPWNTQGIDGVSRFLKKLWRLFHNEQEEWALSEEAASKPELKALHTAIKGVREDLERFAFNTPVSKFMVCVNQLSDLKCRKRAVLEPLVVLLAPYAPHIAEELWALMGHSESVFEATYPVFEAAHLEEDSFEYPISINGKVRTKLEFPLDTPQESIQAAVLADEQVLKWLEGKSPKKVIIVPKKIVNVVV